MRVIKGGGQKDTDWAFEKNGYSKEAFYTSATDGSGHMELLHVKFPQGVPERMAAIVGLVSNYRTTHDLVRDAVIHRMKFLNDMVAQGDGDKLDSELDMIAIEQTLQKKLDNLARKRTFVEALSGRLQTARKEGDRDLWNEIWDSAQAVGQDPNTPDLIAQDIIRILRDNEWS